MTGTDVIDRAVLDGLLDSLGADPDFLAELLQTYFDDAPQQIAAMQAAAGIGDAEGLRRAAHSLKSTSTSFGAMRLAGACKELETLAKGANLDQAISHIIQIEAAYAAAQSALKAIE